MFRRLSLLTTLCLLAAAGVARSTTVIPPTFDQLVAEARTVFVGEVMSQRSVMDTSAQGRTIHTIVTFRVEDVWKGTLGAVTQLEFLGGTVGELTLKVSGMPTFAVDQRSVLFVSGAARSISPLVGLSYGRFRVERSTSDGIDRVRTNDGRSLGAITEIGPQRPSSFQSITPMRLSELAAAVRARQTAGRAR